MSMFQRSHASCFRLSLSPCPYAFYTFSASYPFHASPRPPCTRFLLSAPPIPSALFGHDSIESCLALILSRNAAVPSRRLTSTPWLMANACQIHTMRRMAGPPSLHHHRMMLPRHRPRTRTRTPTPLSPQAYLPQLLPRCLSSRTIPLP